jgi:hypothetical protein
VRTAVIAELVRGHIPPKQAADLLRSVDREFQAALSDNDAESYVMTIEDTKARIDTIGFLETLWLPTWIIADRHYSGIQRQGWQYIPELPRRDWHHGEIGPPSERTDALGSGQRSLLAVHLNLGNLVWRVRKALEAMNADG